MHRGAHVNGACRPSYEFEHDTKICVACSQEKTKLVAEKGKLVEVVERSGIVPNGTAFAITTGAVPDLDSTHLIVGEIVEGMDVVRQLDKLPVVKNNTNSPFFQVRSTVRHTVVTDSRLQPTDGFHHPGELQMCSAYVLFLLSPFESTR